MSQGNLQKAPQAARSAAQQFHHQLQSNADIAWKREQDWQRGTVVLAVLVAVLSVLPCLAQGFPHFALVVQGSRVGLVLVGLSLMVLVGLSQRSPAAQPWRTLATAVATTERALYFYRTLLQQTPERETWLNQQIAKVQQQLQERLQGSWLLQPTEGNPEPLNAADLLPDAYLQERILPQLARSTQQVGEWSVMRDRYQIALVACGGLIVLLPVLSADWLGLGAIAATLGLSLLLWLQMTALNQRVETQSQLALGMTLLRDYWQSLPNSERTGQAFFHLVIATETAIESPYRQMEDQIRKALDLLQEAPQDLVQLTLKQPIPIELEQALQGKPATSIVEHLLDAQEPTAVETLLLKPASTNEGEEEASVESTTPVVETAIVKTNGKAEPIAQPTQTEPAPAPPPPKRGRPHAFVVMPFGRKQGPDGRWIDFNSIYQTLIKPALEEAGFESFRADEEAVSGDILTDMFQELLLAELVIADLSIDNANVFYELGIRHAFRRRGVVHIQAGRSYMPFDIFNVRTLPYHCDESGCPDRQFLEKDKQALMQMIQATWTSERNRVHSPIFNLLTGLIEPDRKTLRTPLATGYWQEYTTLQSRIAIAQRQKRIGDVVLLAEEVSNPLIKEDILAEAGKALRSMGNSALALKQYRQGLQINPDNVEFRCEEAFHLSRLGQSDEAIVKLEKLLEEVLDCVEATAYLARIYKDLWKQNWVEIEDENRRIQAAYEASFLLQKSIANYLRGYQLDQNQYYPGINALTLTTLLAHLAKVAEVKSGDADELAYLRKLSTLKGSVQFCLESALNKASSDNWAALSLGDLAVCVADTPQAVATAYRKALAILWKNKFSLRTTLEQLKLMQLLKFRPEHVQAGITVLQNELDRFEQQEQLFANIDAEESTKPAQIFLFTGHMIDSPQRSKPRFPAAMEAEALQRIEDTLDKLEARANCIAIVPGLACGGDILFVEACLKRNMRVEIYLTFEADKYIQDSVCFAGDIWIDRFNNVLNHPNITVSEQLDRLGPVPVGEDVYGRNNRWALYATLVHDIKRVRLIALWNGQGGDGPGGTADMVQQVRQLGGIVEHIDITKFTYWQEHCTVKEQAQNRLKQVSTTL
jgi:tetratricopeptide (TPR) repeat protein